MGLPDGLTVDAEGGVWVALAGAGQVRRFRADGLLDLVVEVPGAQIVTSCCFGGAHLDQLYIATSTWELSVDQLGSQPGAGKIYRAKPGIKGKPATPFDDSVAGSEVSRTAPRQASRSGPPTP